MLKLTVSKRKAGFFADILFGGFAFVLPFLVLYWVVPFASDFTIGNDYVMFTPSQSKDIQYSLEKGSFPLFVPGLACGRSSSALTLGQMFHPLPHVSRLLPDYWEGNALSNATFLRLILLGCANLLICVFLRKLGLSRVMSLLIGLVTVCNFRMLDMFRYGASLENYTGYLFLATALGFYCLKPTKIIGPISVIVSTYLLVCGGHPQMMYYGLFGAGVIYLALPFAISAILPKFQISKTSLVRFYGISGACIATGILLSSVYIVPFYVEFLSNNIRTAHDYRWSLGYGDTWGGTLNAVFAPLKSDVHGNFGSSALLVLLLFVPVLGILRAPIKKVILILWVAALLIILCAMGGATPVHNWFWHYVPLANSFRTPGRVTMMLPFIFLFLLAWLFKPGQSPATFRKSTLPFLPYVPIAAVSIGLYVYYNLHLIDVVPAPGRYVPGARTPRPEWIDQVVFWSGLSTIVTSFFYGIRVPRGRAAWTAIFGVLMLLGVFAQLTSELRYGTWITNKTKSRTLASMDAAKRRDIRNRVLAGYGLEEPAIVRQMDTSILEPRLAKFYRKYKVVSSDDQAIQFEKKHRDAHTAVVVAPELSDTFSETVDGETPDTVRLLYSSYNRFVFEVRAMSRGVFAFSFPYSPQWKATAGGKSVKISKTNGYLNGVFLPEGTHQLEFRYTSPATIAGFAVSLGLLAVLSGVFAFVGTSSRRRYVIVGFCLVFLIAFFVKWKQSLYTGDNLDVRYEWNSKMLPSPDNIAYGRTTKFYRIRTMEESYRYYAGLAVDGDRNGKPFRTNDKVLPWWEVDLGAIRDFSRIDIYDGFKARSNLPLLVQVSNDRRKFTTILELTQRPREHPWSIAVEGKNARYIRLSSKKKSAMQFKEVEVY